MDISEDGLLRIRALCGRHMRKERATKSAAHAGFFPNYPILGIGLTEGLAYPSSALNFPVQSVFLKPPDTAIRWLFLWARAPRSHLLQAVPMLQPWTCIALRQGSGNDSSRATCIPCHHPSRGLPRRFAAGSTTDYPQVACDRNCKQNACALRQPSAGTMPQLHRAPRDGP